MGRSRFGLAIQVGEGLLAAALGDQHEVPALEVAAGRRLEGEIEALYKQFPLDGAGQVEAFADCPRGGQQLVGGEFARSPASHRTGRELSRSPQPATRLAAEQSRGS